MIDTDKYEGHSEMIDANEIGEIWEYLADTISEDRLERAEANYNLVADAPDLLAEVKRLRDLHILACDYLQGISDGTLPDSEWPHIHAMIRGDEE